MNSNLPNLVHAPKLYVGDQWLTTNLTFPVVNPATNKTLANVPLGSAQTLQLAVNTAFEAFQLHRKTPSHLRSTQLSTLANAIQERAETFAFLIVAEAGKPISLARLEVQRAITTFRIAAEEARHQQGALLDLDATPAGQSHFGLTRRFPVGPIAAITPFNFPLNLVAHKVAPALATGNTVVLKPSPRTPLTALFLAETALASGLPPGLLNVVTCPNEAISGWIAHPQIRLVSFTGSVSVGWALQAQAVGKRCTLELGGNATVIVHEDADLNSAIPAIAISAFAYAGQTCVSTQRVLIHESLYEETKRRLVQFTKESIRSGDPLDAEVLVGPMIDDSAVSRTLSRIQEAIQSGASVLCGGQGSGRILEPTILEHVPSTCALSAEEAFAPVVILERYSDFSEALTTVNTSKFGLQTGIFTNSLPLAWQAFETLEVGAVLINQIPTWRVENMPYGGVKSSGLGREGIRAAMEDMTEPRSWIWKTL